MSPLTLLGTNVPAVNQVAVVLWLYNFVLWKFGIIAFPYHIALLCGLLAFLSIVPMTDIWIDICIKLVCKHIQLQPTPLNGFIRKIHQMTSFWVRKCVLGISMTIFYIRPLKVPKTSILGTDFDWTFAAENRFIVGMLQYKLPLIVIIAP